MGSAGADHFALASGRNRVRSVWRSIARIREIVRRETPSREPSCVGEIPTQEPARVPRVNNQDVLVSIIYNYYMKASTIFTSLERLQNQALTRCSAAEIEIIIIDDGSEGENIGEQLPHNVTYLWQRKFQYGIARAKNTGAKIANGHYLVFLDPDILISEHYIEAMLEGFATYGDDIVQCGYIWDYHFQGCPDPRTEFGIWENPDRPTQRFYQVAGGNMAIVKNIFQRTPGFDEDLIYGGGEDLLFGHNYGKLPGASVYFNRQMESWHIPHPPSPAHASPQKSWEIVKDKHPEFYEAYIVKGLR